MRLRVVLACSLFASSITASAMAQDAPSPPEASPPAPAAETPAPAGVAPREEGMRLGLDLGVTRAPASDSLDTFTYGSPTILPVGVDLSFRTSRRALLGFHGHAGLASRDDCSRVAHCIARSYGLGVHVEAALREGTRFVPWLRYGLGWEMLYQGGTGGNDGAHLNRNGFDLADVRLGADFVISRAADGRTSRIGPFAGVDLGVMTGQNGTAPSRSGFAQASLDRSGGAAYTWLSLGVRGTLEP
jgi:hypothetical protein